MPNRLEIHEVEDALVGHLKAKLPAMQRQIASLTDGDFDGAGDVIVTDLPAVRVFFRSGRLNPGRDITALTYQAALGFVVLCGAQSLRDKADERQDAQKLAGDVLRVLAGKRLENLPSSGQRPQVVLGPEVALFQTGPQGTWYAVAVTVEGITQYEENAA